MVLMCLINGYWVTFSKSDKKAKGKIKSEQGTTDISVYTKNLVSINMKSKDILKNYNSYFKDTKQRNFNGPVLGYVTPWNSHGYDVAKTFGNKLNLVSPVWLQTHTLNLGTKPNYNAIQQDQHIFYVDQSHELAGDSRLQQILVEGQERLFTWVCLILKDQKC